MQCPVCNSLMYKQIPRVIYLTDPPRWEQLFHCLTCNHAENKGMVCSYDINSVLHPKWKDANQLVWANHH